MRRGFVVSVVVLAVMVSSVGSAAASTTAPAFSGDFPDPSLLVVGTTYWAYSTGSGGRNLQVMSSPDLRTWTSPVDPLPVLPGWARPGLTWAPAVVAAPGGFLMYYTVHDATSNRQCVSVATSTTPSGPFTDASSAPLLCQLANGGSIDPSPIAAPTGTYLIWKSDDNAVGAPSHLWSQQLSPDGRSLVGSRSLLLTATAGWQAGVIEGPSMARVGTLYYLFYGANDWSSANAGIGYALCTSPIGPCVNSSAFGPWMGSHGLAVGPSGPDVFVDTAGSMRLAYHAWAGAVGYANGGVRALWIDHVAFSVLRPTIQ
jgi:beta-xylosidase